MTTNHAPTALVTGASRGLGLTVTTQLVSDGWRVITTARGLDELARSSPPLSRDGGAGAVPMAGDVADPVHRTALAEAVGPSLALLVNNASRLGPSPLPSLATVPLPEVATVLDVNVLGPLGLVQACLPALLAAGGTVINISSDAAVGAWPGWGVYGLSKAALDHMTAVLAAEHPELTIHAVDPGDMRTAMHQAAFPDEDISDRPLPSTVVPSLLALVADHAPSGRYRLLEDGRYRPAGREAATDDDSESTDPQTDEALTAMEVDA